MKVDKPTHTYLDRAEQITALLDAAGAMDSEAKSNGKIPRRAMLATLTFAGLRISKLLELRWRDVDLAGGRLRVRQSKTDAGVRHVDLLPCLREMLTEHKANVGERAQPDSLVFPSTTDTRQDRNRVRNRILAVAIKRANERLIEGGLVPLPEGLTLHAVRRTYCSLMLALTPDLAYVMGQMGHSDSAMTVKIYGKVMERSEDHRRQLRDLIEGHYLAVAGSSAADEVGAKG